MRSEVLLESIIVHVNSKDNFFFPWSFSKLTANLCFSSVFKGTLQSYESQTIPKSATDQVHKKQTNVHISSHYAPCQHFGPIIIKVCGVVSDVLFWTVQCPRTKILSFVDQFYTVFNSINLLSSANYICNCYNMHGQLIH